MNSLEEYSGEFPVLLPLSGISEPENPDKSATILFFKFRILEEDIELFERLDVFSDVSTGELRPENTGV